MTSPRELDSLLRSLRARAPLFGHWRRARALRRLAALKDDPAVVPLLLEAADQPHARTSERARAVLSSLASVPAIDALCEAAIASPRSVAAEICRETRRGPSDHDRACVFLFVTGQLDAYFREDDGFQSLRLEYERAGRALREEILRVVRSGDRRCLGFFGARKRLADCTEAEISLALQFFRKHSDWPRLFQAFLELPLKYGFLILRELGRVSWRPDDPTERDFLERALELGRGHLTAPAAANRVPGELFESLLERGRGAPYASSSEDQLIERLARSCPLDGIALTQRLNELAGEHGVGRIDHLEDRLVGIKSREVYEAPAATTLLRAHEALEHMTLSKQQLKLKRSIGLEYAELIYNGLWFSAHHQDLAHYVQSTQRHVTGTVRVRLHKGQATAVGTKSPRSLYATALATYEKGDQYDQSAAEGFIKIWGLPVQVQAQAQLLGQPGDTLRIAAPDDGAP